MSDGLGVFSLLDPEIPYQIYLDRLRDRAVRINTGKLNSSTNITNYREKLKKRMRQTDLETLGLLIKEAEAMYPGRVDITPHIHANLITDIRPRSGYGYVRDISDTPTQERDYYNALYNSFQTIKVKVDNIIMTIHFPELTLRNSKGYSINIKDLYVRFAITFYPRSIAINSLEGIRTTLSVEELSTTYMHSHLPSLNMSQYQYNGFCLGSGLISEIMSYMNLTEGKARFIPRFKVFLKQIKAYLEWESLEGVPHKYMVDVIGKQSLDKVPIPEDLLVEAYSQMRTLRKEKFNVDWELTPSGYKIVDNTKFDAFMKDNVQRHLTYFISNSTNYRGIPIMVDRDREGNYFMKQETQYNEEIKVHEDKYIWFKGQKVCLKVEGNTVVENMESIKTIHPKIKYYVKTRLEIILNNSEVREAGARRIG